LFPGAYCPALSEVTPAIERSGLLTTDIEVLRLHYAETLRHWRRRFAANRSAIAALYDVRFCRQDQAHPGRPRAASSGSLDPVTAARRQRRVLATAT
jgi:hypothetical protein